MAKFNGPRGGGERREGGFNNNRGGSREFSRPSFGGKSSRFSGGRSGGRDSGPAEMFGATCDGCHQKCEVPFRPNGSKPVYCSDCFSQMREGESHGHSDNRSGGRSNERPRKDFGRAPAAQPQVSDRRIDDIKKQLDIVAGKIETLTQIIKDNISTPDTKKTVNKEVVADTQKKEPTKVAKKEVVKKTVKKGALKKAVKKAVTKKVVKKSTTKKVVKKVAAKKKK